MSKGEKGGDDVHQKEKEEEAASIIHHLQQHFHWQCIHLEQPYH
jgi:hypothetical protein